MSEKLRGDFLTHTVVVFSSPFCVFMFLPSWWLNNDVYYRLAPNLVIESLFKASKQCYSLQAAASLTISRMLTHTLKLILLWLSTDNELNQWCTSALLSSLETPEASTESFYDDVVSPSWTRLSTLRQSRWWSLEYQSHPAITSAR